LRGFESLLLPLPMACASPFFSGFAFFRPWPLLRLCCFYGLGVRRLSVLGRLWLLRGLGPPRLVLSSAAFDFFRQPWPPPPLFPPQPLASCRPAPRLSCLLAALASSAALASAALLVLRDLSLSQPSWLRAFSCPPATLASSAALASAALCPSATLASFPGPGLPQRPSVLAALPLSATLAAVRPSVSSATFSLFATLAAAAFSLFRGLCLLLRTLAAAAA